MPWVEIKAQRHKAAYQFTCDTWRRTHADTEAEENILYPSFFSAKIETYHSFLYRIVWETHVRVPALRPAALQQGTYEQALRQTLCSPLYSLTVSAIQYLTNYANTRENSFFRRDSSISHPRNQIIAYLCDRLCELEKQQLNEALIESYEKECLFITLLLENAHQFFPTSSLSNGRHGFHALLINVQQCARSLQYVIRTHLERKTLKEHIGQLAHLTQALHLDITRFIAHSLNATLPQKFNVHHFSKNPDAYEFSAYRKSTLGQWMLQLLHHKKQLGQDNPWLENTETLAHSIFNNKYSGIPLIFLSNFSLLSQFCKLHGIVLEFQHLESLLAELEEVAALAGDYSIAHNKNLFAVLHQSLLCWKKLGDRAKHLVRYLSKAQQDEIRKAPAKNPLWVVHHRFSLSIQSSVTENIDLQSSGVIKKITASTEKLQQLGYGEYQRKMNAVISHTEAFIKRLCYLKLVDPRELVTQKDKETYEPLSLKEEKKISIAATQNTPLTTAIHDIFCDIDLTSSARILSALKTLRELLLRQHWPLVRYAGIGGRALRFCNKTYLLPHHIHDIVNAIDTALFDETRTLSTFHAIFLIAENALQNPPNYFGFFSSRRNPLVQATYECLANELRSSQSFRI